MSYIKDNCEVEIEFVLKTKRGEIVDSSEEEGPLKYIHGKKRISPQLEEQLRGRQVGDTFSFKVKPKDAYGERDESLVQFAKKEVFGESFGKIKNGMPIEIEMPDGEVAVATALEVKEDGILLDGNHPLAGESLVYEIKVLKINDLSLN